MGSLILVLTEPPHAQPSPLQVRPVTSYQDHLAAIEVTNQGFAFPAGDALDARRRALPASSPSGLAATACGCWHSTATGRWRR